MLPFLMCVLSILFYLPRAFSEIAEDWDVNHEVPEIITIGETSPEEQQLIEELRPKLIKNLQYWKDHGLPNPPDLESIIVLTDLDNIGAREVLQLMNPGLPDIGGHVKAQYARLMNSRLLYELRKRLGTFIKNRDIRMPVNRLANRAFDFYFQVRYGFPLGNSYQHVAQNTPFSRISKSDLGSLHDNAFYGKFIPIDLTDVLASIDTPAELVAEDGVFLKGFDFKQLSGKLKKLKLSRRITILPRMTQERGDLAVSTVRDDSVVSHELGHHINATLSSDSLHRMIDEAFADYLAAAPVENPRIGEFFAQATAIIVERLRTSPSEPADLDLAQRLQEVAESGVLRDLSVSVQIDELARTHLIANDYDSGNPLRSFLWRVRTRMKDQVDVLDQVVLDSIAEFSRLPMLASSRTHFIIGARQVWIQVLQALELANLKKKIRDAAKKEGISVEETEIDRYAKIKLSHDIQEREKKAIQKRNSPASRGGDHRVPIHADYVLPEFLRVIYRNAQMASPDLARTVREEAERAMNSSSLSISLGSGLPEELVFLRKNSLMKKTDVRRKVERLVEDLAVWRKALLEESETSTGSGQPVMSVADMLRKYSASLEKLQEFERTGSPSRLNHSHPWLEFLGGLFKGHKVQIKLAPLSPEELSCETLLSEGD